jgi:group I intron endonuclease
MKLRYDQVISGIYMIKNLSNGKMYIGKAKNLYRRRHQHFQELKRNKHKNPYLQNAVNKYGIQNFEFVVIECAFIEMLSKSEYYWCEYYKSYQREYGYNIDKLDSTGTTIRSFESIEKQKKSTNSKIRIPRKGKLNHSSKKVYQYDLKGNFIREHESCHMAAEFIGDRSKFSAIAFAARKKLYRYGYQWRYVFLENVDFYDINKRKENAIKAGKTTSKMVKAKNIKTGEVVIFSSISEAAKSLNIAISCIARIAKGERKISKKLNMEFEFIN